MIKVESIMVKEIRGVRDLVLKPDQKSFVITGPNGSGKSAVVDAIDFCLSGTIARLKGEGTANVSTKQHGPHVDHREDPGAAEVRMRVRLTGLNVSVEIRRNMKKPNDFTINPDTDQIRTVLADVSSHPELVLSRREITSYVLATSNDLATRVQELLRLDRVNVVRRGLTTARNRLVSVADAARSSAKTARDSLHTLLETDAHASPDLMPALLAAANERRSLLGLSVLGAIDENTALDEGASATGQSTGFNKQSALADIDKLRPAIEGFAGECVEERTRMLVAIERVERDSTIQTLLKQGSLVSDGLKLLTSALCPLCDMQWPDIESLRAHLAQKLATSKDATTLQARLLADAKLVASACRALSGLTKPVVATAKAEFASTVPVVIEQWAQSLEEFASSISDLEGVVAAKASLQSWETPATLIASLDRHRAEVTARPDESATGAARSFLTRAQERLHQYRSAMKESARAERSSQLANVVLETHSQSATEILTSLYHDVEEKFASYYRAINSEDESDFSAQLTPSAGKLDLAVDFHGTGKFPPRAYHSEGHQDGMGVCLYFALMRRLLGDRFQLAVLDDVVMSIDGGHRRAFCRLLREQFPDTQFIITTHDPIWARQLRTEHIVDGTTIVEFQDWSVKTGPIFEPVSEVWSRIANDLAHNDVPSAAARLRRHLEYVARELADEIAAPIPYRGDARYELAELFEAVLARQQKLIGMAAASADSWSNDVARREVAAMKEVRRKAVGEYGDEFWAINPAVHYNEWATFSKQDFESVVWTMRTLIEQFQCPGCRSWILPSPKLRPESLRCRCSAVNVNLVKKSGSGKS